MSFVCYILGSPGVFLGGNQCSIDRLRFVLDINHPHFLLQSKARNGGDHRAFQNRGSTREDMAVLLRLSTWSRKLSQMPFHFQVHSLLFHLMKHDNKAGTQTIIVLSQLTLHLCLDLTLFPMETPELVSSDAEHIAALRFFHRLRCVAVPWCLCALVVFLFFGTKSICT